MESNSESGISSTFPGHGQHGGDSDPRLLASRWPEVSGDRNVRRESKDPVQHVTEMRDQTKSNATILEPLFLIKQQILLLIAGQKLGKLIFPAGNPITGRVSPVVKTDGSFSPIVSSLSPS